MNMNFHVHIHIREYESNMAKNLMFIFANMNIRASLHPIYFGLFSDLRMGSGAGRLCVYGLGTGEDLNLVSRGGHRSKAADPHAVMRLQHAEYLDHFIGR
jgi:hypothetical protein